MIDVTIQTDVDGGYVFADLRPADATGYTITETQPVSFLDGVDTAGSLGGDATVDDVISAIPVAPGDVGIGYTFGEVEGAVVSGTVFVDASNDGVQDAGEIGVEGAAITLTGTDDLGNPVTLVTTTDVDGNWTFTGLRPSDAVGYSVTETATSRVVGRH